MLRVLLVDSDAGRRSRLSSRLRGLPAVEEVEAVAGLDGLGESAAEEADLVLSEAGAGVPGWEEELRRMSRMTFVVPLVDDEEGVRRAYDAGAFDVLLPGADRLPEIVQRARNALQAMRLRDGPNPAAQATVPNTILGGAGYVSKFLARSGARIYFVDQGDVLWIRGAGNYIELHTTAGLHLVRATLGAVEPRLDPARFRRIHRSTIVSLDAVGEVHSDGHGQYVVLLRNGTALQLTRTFRGNLLSGRAG